MSDWQSISTAPKGGGAEMVTDPKWVEPPKILLCFREDVMRVACWDWYYAEGGNGAWESKRHAWVEPTSGSLLVLHYDQPIGWRPLPTPPKGETD